MSNFNSSSYAKYYDYYIYKKGVGVLENSPVWMGGFTEIPSAVRDYGELSLG